VIQDGLAPALAATRSETRGGRAANRLHGVRLVVDGRPMRGMDTGPWASLGSFGWFLGIWIVMMAAMVAPSAIPTVALHARRRRLAARGTAGLLFALGILLLAAPHAVPALTIPGPRPMPMGG
jgi:predicted metal-binding membrane protein